MVDKIILTLMIISLIITTHLVSYEFGKKAQCNSNKDYKYSLDLGVCLKVGYENVYGSLK